MVDNIGNPNMGIFNNQAIFNGLFGAESDINKKLMVKNCGSAWLTQGTQGLTGEAAINDAIRRMAAVYYLTFAETGLRGLPEASAYVKAAFEGMVPFLPERNYLEEQVAITKIQMCVLWLVSAEGMRRVPQAIAAVPAFNEAIAGIRVRNIVANQPGVAGNDVPQNEIVQLVAHHNLNITRQLLFTDADPEVRITPLGPYMELLKCFVNSELNPDTKSKAYSMLFSTIAALVRRGSLTQAKLDKLSDAIRKLNGAVIVCQPDTARTIWEGLEQYVTPAAAARLFAQWHEWIPRTAIELKVFVQQAEWKGLTAYTVVRKSVTSLPAIWTKIATLPAYGAELARFHQVARILANNPYYAYGGEMARVAQSRYKNCFNVARELEVKVLGERTMLNYGAHQGGYVDKAIIDRWIRENEAAADGAINADAMDEANLLLANLRITLEPVPAAEEEDPDV